MNGHRRNVGILLCVLFIVSVSPFNVNESFSHFKRDWAEEELYSVGTTSSPVNYTDDWDQACSSVIVTGTATKDGRAILMKNRDLIEDPVNIPVYIPATANTPTLPTTPTFSNSSTDDPTSTTSSLLDTSNDSYILSLTVGASSGFFLVMLIALIRRRIT